MCSPTRTFKKAHGSELGFATGEQAENTGIPVRWFVSAQLARQSEPGGWVEISQTVFAYSCFNTVARRHPFWASGTKRPQGELDLWWMGASFAGPDLLSRRA